MSEIRINASPVPGDASSPALLATDMPEGHAGAPAAPYRVRATFCGYSNDPCGEPIARFVVDTDDFQACLASSGNFVLVVAEADTGSGGPTAGWTAQLSRGGITVLVDEVDTGSGAPPAGSITQPAQEGCFLTVHPGSHSGARPNELSARRLYPHPTGE